MMLLAQILFNIALFVYLPWLLARSFIRTKKGKYKQLLKMILGTIRHQIKVNSDLFTNKEIEELKELRSEAQEIIKSKDYSEKGKFILEIEESLKKFPARKRQTFATEWTETIVVALAVAFGARAMFLQPFKIPTASMQPTLFGIHLEEIKDKPADYKPDQLSKFFDYWNYSWRYPQAYAEQDGYVAGFLRLAQDKENKREMVIEKSYLSPNPKAEPENPARTQPFDDLSQSPVMRSLFPEIKLTVPFSKHKEGITPSYGNKRDTLYTVPGETKNCLFDYYEYLEKKLKDGAIAVKKGDNMLPVRHTLGDHLFVDRVTFNFREPIRGDITVFITDHIGGASAGRYYIKRLVGLPGDTLRVGDPLKEKNDRMLYVKTKGSDEFVPLDGKFHQAFTNMYSMRGGYRGYTKGSPANEYNRYGSCFQPNFNVFGFEEPYKNMPFRANDDLSFTIPPGFYFMMGDNSENSKDSRYFGPVPRENIVCRALINYWPFSRRWGIVDTTDPDDFDSEIEIEEPNGVNTKLE